MTSRILCLQGRECVGGRNSSRLVVTTRQGTSQRLKGRHKGPFPPPSLFSPLGSVVRPSAPTASFVVTGTCHLRNRDVTYGPRLLLPGRVDGATDGRRAGGRVVRIVGTKMETLVHPRHLTTEGGPWTGSSTVMLSRPPQTGEQGVSVNCYSWGVRNTEEVKGQIFYVRGPCQPRRRRGRRFVPQGPETTRKRVTEP